MCYIDKYELIYPDGTRVPQQRVIPCVRGTGEQPCDRTRTRRQPAVHTMQIPAATPAIVAGEDANYVEVQPRPTRSNTTAQTLRSRRGRERDDLRLEFNWHIPFTSHDGGDEKERPHLGSAGYRPMPPPPVGYVLSRSQTVRAPAVYPGQWQEWEPRVITVDPAFNTPPATPQSSRRSRSEGPSPPLAGREHVRGHSRQRSESSTRHGSRHASPPRRSTEEERNERTRELTARIDRLRREREEARASRARDERIAELTERIRDLQRQRTGRTRIVELHHQDGTRTEREVPRGRAEREAPRGGAGGGRSDFLRNTGRRAIQRDMDEEEESRRPPPRIRGGPRGRIAGPEEQDHTFARLFSSEQQRRSDSRRRDRRTERMVYAGEGPRPHRWF